MQDSSENENERYTYKAPGQSLACRYAIKSGYDHCSYSFHFKLLVSRNHTLDVQSVAQSVRNLPALQATRTHSLDQEDPLEMGMTTYSSIFAWRIPWTEESTEFKIHGVAQSQTQLSDYQLSPFHQDYRRSSSSASSSLNSCSSC